MDNNLPEEVEAYFEKIIQHLTGYLKDQLVGMYLFNLISYNIYKSSLSNLDIQNILKNLFNNINKQIIIYYLN